ncbi:hypothetical protein GKZ68_05670 [Hymenobacter sp. BRD128]|uniref:hypothetical protein n=1 Tax=Hymenobacter sp. BRD128 TaxID=2675878 RepID=UPI0015667EBD|nr:hypothetical protein [Hymenobacter sp. BRD128]QKG56178.1 hypothetical protein GKZ68_05670 [Hymenobacter sp. BRD128]
MKSVILLLDSGLPFAALAQASAARPDSMTITIRPGSDNPELHQLMANVLHVEKWHIEARSPGLAGQRFHLTYQEVINGVAGPEQELTGSPTRQPRFDKLGNFTMDAFAHQATETTLLNQFYYAAGGVEKTFTALPGQSARYRLSPNLWTYKALKSLGPPVPGQQPTAAHTFPVGKKVPFLVYTLPYKSGDYLLYCDVIQSKVPVNEWFAKFKITHFVVYNLVVE